MAKQPEEISVHSNMHEKNSAIKLFIILMGLAAIFVAIPLGIRVFLPIQEVPIGYWVVKEHDHFISSFDRPESKVFLAVGDIYYYPYTFQIDDRIYARRNDGELLLFACQASFSSPKKWIWRHALHSEFRNPENMKKHCRNEVSDALITAVVHMKDDDMSFLDGVFEEAKRPGHGISLLQLSCSLQPGDQPI